MDSNHNLNRLNESEQRQGVGVNDTRDFRNDPCG